MFPSSFDGKNVTLKEYVSRMKEDQKEIYYACGETKERIEMLPQLEKIKDKGYEVLYFTQDVDEFAIKVMINYDGKPFKSISDADLDLDTEEEKEEAKKLDEENKDMFAFMQEAIADKVKTVRLSKKLKTHPVCLSSDGSITIEMEKVLNAMPQNDGNKVKAEKALEINPNHPIFEKLKDLYANDKDKLKDYAKLLYDQALLIEGMSIDNPVEFGKPCLRAYDKVIKLYRYSLNIPKAVGTVVFPRLFVLFRLIIVGFIQNKMSLFVKKTDLKNKFYVCC